MEEREGRAALALAHGFYINSLGCQWVVCSRLLPHLSSRSRDLQSVAKLTNTNKMNSDMTIPRPIASGLSPYLVGALLALFIYLVGYYLNSPLRQYPGPILAKFTNLWRLYHITRGNFHQDVIRLHKKYGPVVRIGPNVLDVDDPALLKTVFNIKGDWKKTEYYRSSSAFVGGRIVHNLFSQDDKDKHAAEKKPVAKYYSPTGVVLLEPLVDKVIRQLCDELDKRFITKAATGKTFDLGNWILYYAWDVVGTVTFSQPMGYLSAGIDFDGTLHAAEKLLDYFSWVGCIPFLDHLLEKNRIVQLFGLSGGFSGLASTCVSRLVARYQGADAAHHQPTQPDYLDRFIEAKAADPDGISDNQIVSWIMINMGAGADTTAITIRSALYYSLRTPGVWARLRNDLATAGLTAAECPLSLRQARTVPYLEGIIREALRYLPGVSLGLERYVPAGGQRLASPSSASSHLPAGTVLAFNPFIICRNRDVWGDDADDFRPGRWLRADGESEQTFARRLRVMNDADLSFGAGSRTCIGKHLGLMQAYKVVATLALCYDIELAHPEREWTIINSWFPRQKGLDVRMVRRAT
ncbi:cytochrome P450 [Lasiosphaeria hispida]|uniref:Cytochrome P450 n=1 Tax=Lasiosphaeria hispida TaxID=260671 RepID=A0AAJ0HLC0_9PEZI|nr:cytochrome P450 [Lasiosphaeria hispida]